LTQRPASGKRPDRFAEREIVRRLSAAASLRSLALAFLHAICTAGVHLSSRAEVTGRPPDLAYALFAVLVPAAVLALMLYGISALWSVARLGADQVPIALLVKLGRWRRPVEALLLLGALAGTVALAAHFWPAVDIFVWVIGGLWVASAASLLALRRLPGAGPAAGWQRLRPVLSMDDVIADATAGAWTAALLLELIWHAAAAHFMDIRDTVAFVHAMAAEADAMLLGPEAPKLAALIVLYLMALAVFVKFGRAWRAVPALHRWYIGPRQRAAAYGITLAVGLFAWHRTPLTERTTLLHHIHPTVDGLAHWLTVTAGDPVAAQARAAAAQLAFPDRLQALARATPPQAMPALTWAKLPRHTPRARNVVLVFIDSITRQHLDVYGYSRSVAPNIRRLARQGRLFTAARTNGGHTDLATVALLYSLLPELNPTKADDYTAGHGGVPVHLLARAAGWHAGVFSSDWEGAEHGYAPMFPGLCDAFLDARTTARTALAPEVHRWAGVREDRIVDAFSAWYRPLHARGAPFFAYVKFLRPHSPYYTPPPTQDPPELPGWHAPFAPAAEGFGIADFHPPPARRSLLINRYDNALIFADQQLGRLLDDLQQSGAARDTAIVLLSDHGEAFGEHGLYAHGMHLYEEFVDIPLILHIPGEAAATDARAVTTVDVAPTLLDVLGLPSHPSYQGHSLLDAAFVRGPYFAFSNIGGRMAALQVENQKRIEDLDTGESWLFDLAADRGETRNLALEPAHRVHALALSGLLDAEMTRQLAAMQELRRHPTRELLAGLPARAK